MLHIVPHDVDGHGTPVVLLHGSMNTRRQWRRLFDELTPTHRPVAVDLTGYGEAPFPEDPETHSMEAEAERVHGLMYDHLKAQGPCHLVGHSYGGAVALCYAVLFPEAVKSLVLFEPMSNHVLGEADHPLHDDGKALIERIEVLHGAGDDAGAAREFFDHLTGTDGFRLLPAGARKALSTGVGKMLLDYRTTVSTSLTLSDYRQIACPVCLATGRHSPELTTAISAILRDHLKQVRVVSVPGDHMAPVFNASAVNALVKEHLGAV
ncbi:alpha/beta fold hydrolase [Desulfoluna spongiiphila]|uniref:alpha/beta fold hydrolase n=1 Tax=Desulfoluna spongiiphila TaxID=419481 RepID=UPI001253CD90|nr:alpha/beta hydrolase [Desulfoluna spongiiphila]VVS91192.1 alpha/beta hydrolase fold [Desulfoluna spongiiphila]